MCGMCNADVYVLVGCLAAVSDPVRHSRQSVTDDHQQGDDEIQSAS